jgi:hypothetical protein
MHALTIFDNQMGQFIVKTIVGTSHQIRTIGHVGHVLPNQFDQLLINFNHGDGFDQDFSQSGSFQNVSLPSFSFFALELRTVSWAGDLFFARMCDIPWRSHDMH